MAPTISSRLTTEMSRTTCPRRTCEKRKRLQRKSRRPLASKTTSSPTLEEDLPGLDLEKPEPAEPEEPAKPPAKAGAGVRHRRSRGSKV